MAASRKIVDLRKLLAERFPQPFTPPSHRLATGLPAIDEAIGGGLPKSAITELSSPQVERRKCALALRSFAKRTARWPFSRFGGRTGFL